MEGQPRVDHPLSAFIVTEKDNRSGKQQILRIPFAARHESQPDLDYSLASPRPSVDSIRGRADGGTDDEDWRSSAADGDDPLEVSSNSSFDDFSDGEQVRQVQQSTVGSSLSPLFQVNIIEVVNGKPSTENEVGDDIALCQSESSNELSLFAGGRDLRS